MSNQEPVAIIHQIVTVSVTFVQKPGDLQRQRLKDAGFRYENGKWFKSQTQGHHADEATVTQLIAAS